MLPGSATAKIETLNLRMVGGEILHSQTAECRLYSRWREIRFAHFSA